MKQTGGYTAEERAPILRFKCPRCGALPQIACKTERGQDCMPHKSRVLRSRAPKRYRP